MNQVAHNNDNTFVKEQLRRNPNLKKAVELLAQVDQRLVTVWVEKDLDSLKEVISNKKSHQSLQDLTQYAHHISFTNYAPSSTNFRYSPSYPEDRDIAQSRILRMSNEKKDNQSQAGLSVEESDTRNMGTQMKDGDTPSHDDSLIDDGSDNDMFSGDFSSVHHGQGDDDFDSNLF